LIIQFADAVVDQHESLTESSSLAISHLCACEKVAASLDWRLLYLDFNRVQM